MILNDKITYMKAIGIVLMVIGHCIYGLTILRQVIYMFHMPLFFFAAGYCLNRDYLNDKFNGNDYKEVVNIYSRKWHGHEDRQSH